SYSNKRTKYRLLICPSPRLPVRAQEPHSNHVPVAAVVVVGLPQHALLNEADLGVGPPAALVVLIDVQPNAVEVQGGKGVIGDQPRGLGAVALAPLVLVAQEDPEAGAAVFPVDAVQSRSPDQPVILAQSDAKHDLVFALAQTIDEVELLLQVHRSMDQQ